jgi:hypothetical protein
MKPKFKILPFVLFFLFGTAASGQTGVAENLDSLQANPTKYLTPMQYAFMFHEETPWMIKGSIINTGFSNPYYSTSDNDLVIGFERRIKGALTANLSANVLRYLNEPSSGNISASLRYYYTMKARKEKENIPFNLSGNYVEAGVDFSFFERQHGNYFTPGNDFDLFDNTNMQPTYFVKWGMQRRYLKYGFVDIGVMASYKRFPLRYGASYGNIRFNSTTSFGIAFAKDKSNLNKGKLCSVIKCYEEQKSALKLDASGLLNVNVNKYSGRVNFQPEISYERKIGESIFSINNTVQLSLGSNTDVNSTNLSYGAEYTLETRMYFNLRRRIQKGKTGNGLSANYISLGVFNNYANNNFENSNLNTGLNSGGIVYTPRPLGEEYGFLLPQITAGIQRFIGDHFYYDMGISYRPESARFIETERIYSSDAEFNLYSKVGYRF